MRKYRSAVGLVVVGAMVLPGVSCAPLHEGRVPYFSMVRVRQGETPRRAVEQSGRVGLAAEDHAPAVSLSVGGSGSAPADEGLVRVAATATKITQIRPAWSSVTEVNSHVLLRLHGGHRMPAHPEAEFVRLGYFQDPVAPAVFVQGRSYTLVFAREGELVTVLDGDRAE